MSILHLSYFMLDLNSSDLQITILMFAMFGTRHIPQFFSPSSILSHFKIKHNQLYTNVLGIFVKNKSLVVDRDTQHPPPLPPTLTTTTTTCMTEPGGRWEWEMWGTLIVKEIKGPGRQYIQMQNRKTRSVNN